MVLLAIVKIFMMNHCFLLLRLYMREILELFLDELLRILIDSWQNVKRRGDYFLLREGRLVV